MLSKTHISLALLIIPLSALTMKAEEPMDKVLAEIQALRQQVTALETRLEKLENSEQPAAAVADNTVQPKEKKGWFDNMRVELKKAEVRASGAWTTPSSWDAVENGLTEDEVIAALGEPTSRKFSVRKDTDEIFLYQGDLEGTGELVEGEIRIYKGKVRRFNTPDFPTE